MAPKANKAKRAEQAGQLNIFDALATYTAAKEEIAEQCNPKQAACSRESVSEAEDCIEIAAAIKRSIRESGLSREQVCDAMNAHWGRTEEKHKNGECQRPLSYEMFNHYLSKPVEYPIKAYFLFAIHRITQSLEPARAIVSAEGAEVTTKEDLAMLAIGKLEKNISEMQQLKRELKKQGIKS
ncbi:MAG: hypothetical protein AB7U29_09205 [Desulfobulbus sp.]